MPHRTHLALVALLLALVALAAPRANAAERPYKVYVPAVNCESCTGVLPDPTPIPSPPPAPVTPTPEPAVYAARMIELVNGARAAAGCPAVTANDALMRGAQAWSEKMDRENFAAHTIGGYYDAYGYLTVRVENIGSGLTPEWAYDSWMLSPRHKANIEWCYPPDDPSYDPAMVYDIGIGYMDGYWTLVIGNHLPIP